MRDREEELPRVHKLIHNFLSDIRESCFAKKKEIIKGVEKGKMDVMGVFNIRKNKGDEVIVPGVKVDNGKVAKKHICYIFRNSIPISDPLHIQYMKSFKKDMGELKKGDEATVCFNEDISGII
jgi:translation initiation factor IF-2